MGYDCADMIWFIFFGVYALLWDFADGIDEWDPLQHWEAEGL